MCASIRDGAHRANAPSVPISRSALAGNNKLPEHERAAAVPYTKQSYHSIALRATDPTTIRLSARSGAAVARQA
jgi:hypothetical protein